MKNEETKEKKTTSKQKTTSTRQSSKKQTSQGKTTPKKGSSVKKETSEKKMAKENKKEKDIVKEELETEEIEVEEILEEKVPEVVVEKSSKKKFKTSDLLLVVGLAVVVVLGFFVLTGEKEEPNYTLPLTLSGEAGLHQLTYAEYQEKIDQNESFVVIIERATCSHCVSFMPVAEQFATDNNLPMYYVDTDTFSEDDWSGFEKSNTFLKKNIGKWGTPTTVVLAGRDAVDYIEGESTADELLKIYQKYFEMGE